MLIATRSLSLSFNTASLSRVQEPLLVFQFSLAVASLSRVLKLLFVLSCDVATARELCLSHMLSHLSLSLSCAKAAARDLLCTLCSCLCSLCLSLYKRLILHYMLNKNLEHCGERERERAYLSFVCLPCAFSDLSLLLPLPSPSPFRLINAISGWMERWFLFYLSLTGLGPF